MTIITGDAMHRQKDHVAYLATRRARWLLTVEDDRPLLRKQLASLPWRAVSDATRAEDRGHGRRKIRTPKTLTVATGIDFPHAT
ncbi:hypothetical protein [Catenuloplanes indicus]|uniref:Transposase n=1 Tax=Catenuloplanes indicus TaxID=137267 RepID=A0AAE3W0R8_9ACTN|nr:hypothetical protein [Catenuloplanes indicus]MDQ0366802.1 hypothetical protein [Catenuloplanes indicus]